MCCPLKVTGTGVWSSSAIAGVGQWLHEDALGNLSAARISARMEMNIRYTLVNCSKKLVGGRGKRRGEVGLPFSPALSYSGRLMTGSYCNAYNCLIMDRKCN